ncbi:MAG TPA: hypothetical protein VLA00_10215 [Xanthobacteraceae bacterium]|nr:hypothetical protein [Xanthobacteraceae bacterium]
MSIYVFFKSSGVSKDIDITDHFNIEDGGSGKVTRLTGVTNKAEKVELMPVPGTDRASISVQASKTLQNKYGMSQPLEPASGTTETIDDGYL